MSTQSLRVTFLKGTGELSIAEGSTAQGYNNHDQSYVYRAPDGIAYLMAATGWFGRVRRYFFSKGDVTAPFPTEADRDAYMKRINDACGEVVAVPAAAA